MSERKIKPPRLAEALFAWYCDNAGVDDLRGDMEELFYANLEKMPPGKARRKFWAQTLSLIVSYAIKKRKRKSAYPSHAYHFLHYHMINHYIRIASRHALKNKTFTVINVAGLSIGIAVCVLLALFIRDEWSYDRHFDGVDRMYRLTTMTKSFNGQTSVLQRASPAIGPAMLTEFPEFESGTRVVKDLSTIEQMVKYKDKTFFEKRGYQVETNFFDMFPYDFKEGNPKTAVKELWSIVLSEELAAKIFGSQPALNEFISVPTLSDTGVFRVTGVIRHSHLKSHLDADFYVSGLEESLKPITTWATSNFVFTYFKVKPGVDIPALVAKFPALMTRYGDKENQVMGRKKILGLQPLADVHLRSKHFDNDIELGESGSITYVYMAAAIGILILALATINFINLTTIKASHRAGEIGVRKTIGAQRINLFVQFIGESMAIALIAMVAAMALVYAVLPFFNTLIQKDLDITRDNLWWLGETILVLTLLAGFSAGIYPALVLSSFAPAKALKDKQLQLGSSQHLRKGLIAFQFAISIILISCILVIQDQLHFIQSKPLGFDTMRKIMVPLRTSEATNHYVQFKAAIAAIPGVEKVTASSNSPSTPPVNDWNFYLKGKTQDDAIPHYIVMVDEDYFKLMSIRSAAGRDFSFPSDAKAASGSPRRPVIVNRTSAAKLGIDFSKVLGTELTYAQDLINLEIVGVVEDFHQFSMHKPITPIIFFPTSDSGVFHQTIIALNDEYTEATLEKIREAWVKFIPDTPFESEPLNDRIQRQYENDRRISALVSYSTVLAVVISCLGLYGLSMFIAEKRRKEIGIRKVMGANVRSIIVLLSREFMMILLAAFVVGAPLSYWFSVEWLRGFAYRVEPGAGVFLVAGVLCLTIVMLVTAYESLKAARANPVDSLKME